MERRSSRLVTVLNQKATLQYRDANPTALKFTGMMLSRRQLLAGGAVLVAGAGIASVGLASRPSARGVLDTAVRRGESAVSRRFGSAAAPPPSSVTITVDPSHILRPISPLIYGLAHANPDQLLALGAQLNRWGGNPNTRYNWVNGAWNAARDWEFRNYGNDSGAASTPGAATDGFVRDNLSVGVESVLTVPAIGWVSRTTDKQVQSVGVPADGGPPLALNGDSIAGYDPTSNRLRTSVRSLPRKKTAFVDTPEPGDGPVYQDEFVHHLVTRFGRADDGGVRYYVIDNEPDIWSYTHTDVHPAQISYDQTLATFLDYATAIKAVDPRASVAGPALSGWTGYFYSALDRGTNAYRTHADRQAHGDMPFLPWWLDQLRTHDEQAGARSLDVLDVHYYPQAANVFGAADDAYTRGLRLRSTRSLWDPSYLDESWINDTVRLVPRMREWIDQYYPGTRLAIGEWNWGAEKSMSGALAIADVLGIFGREGVDLASYWMLPATDTPAAQAFQLYTRYNAQGDAFGDQAIDAKIDASADFVTTYASIDSTTNDIVIIALNKRSDGDVAAAIKLRGSAIGSGRVYHFGEGDAEIRTAGSTPAGADLRVNLPATSMTLLRLSRAS
jgi:hypothetical protein